MNPTAEQQSVIDHDAGHSLVVSVAGSGKSTTLIQRIGKLLSDGMDPRRVLVLMFNKSAQDDFAKRLKDRFSEEFRVLPEVMTFHAFGLRLCGRFVNAGYLSPAQVLSDDWKVHALVRDLLKEWNHSSIGEPIDPSNENVAEIVESIDFLKGEIFKPGMPVPVAVNPNFAKVFVPFEEERAQMGFRTFTDMIYDPVRLMLDDPEAAAFASNRYDAILVDEFQDINSAQCQMLRVLAGSRAAVMAVGDDDQTIYRFRGARPDYLVHRFDQMFPGAKRYTLSRTFRFGHEVALCANHVIRNNVERIPKTCIPGTEQVSTVECILHPSQGTQIAGILQKWREQGRSLGEAAILVREFAHTVTAERALLAARIPYQIQGALPFFDRSLVLALRANLQLANGGIGQAPAEQRQALAEALLSVPSLFIPAKFKDPLVRRLVAGVSAPQVANEALAGVAGSPSYRTRPIDQAQSAWVRIGMHKPTDSALEVLRTIVSAHDLYNVFAKSSASSESAASKSAMVQELLQMAKETSQSVSQFIAYLNELSENAANKPPGGVLITSIHRAKGLEWPLVIAPELVEGKFPSADEAEIEDERRLCYVLFTRAKERLVLMAPPDPNLVSWAEKDMKGYPRGTEMRASRFLYEARLISSKLAVPKLAKAGDVAAAYATLVA